MVIDKVLTFVHDSGFWYIDLPEWKGSRNSLLMVGGADTLLEYLSQKHDKISLKIRNWWSGEDNIPIILTDAASVNKTENETGATYLVKGMNLEIWLCSVTKFVFGGFFPPKLYFQVYSRKNKRKTKTFATFSSPQFKNPFGDSFFLENEKKPLFGDFIH